MKRGLAKTKRRLFSAESFFIRTGKIPKGLNRRRARRLGTRFLSSVWFREATKKAPGKKQGLPLPTFRQRIHGGMLPKADVALIREQASFALKQFALHLKPKQFAGLEKKVNGMVSARILSVNIALREKTNADLRQMHVQGKELLTILRNQRGEMHVGLMQDKSGKVYFAKGWGNKKSEKGIALHETLHVLQKLGVIKIDVPFAEAARWLYCLEKREYKPNPNFRMPAEAEFDRKALPEKNDSSLLYEAQWSYALGGRIAQWLYKNVPEKKRWDYLRLRCNNVNHAGALKAIGHAASAAA